MKTLLITLLLGTGLAGCAVYTPSGAVIVDPNGAIGSGGNGNFCPPGQAKKGNC